MPDRLLARLPEDFVPTEREQVILNAVHEAMRRVAIWAGTLTVFILISSMVGLYFYTHTQTKLSANQVEQTHRNCLTLRAGRIENNRRTQILHDYLVASRQLSNRERPLIKPFIDQFPGLAEIIDAQHQLTNQLIRAESPLPVPTCN